MVAAAALLLASWQAKLTLAAVGDIMLDRYVGRRISRGGDPLAEVRTRLSSADICIGNLECPLTTHPKQAHKQFVFKADPGWAKHLSCFEILSVANNHSLDCGEVGFRDSLATLKAQGIGQIGLAPVRVEIVSKNGIKVGFLAYSDFDQGEQGILHWSKDLLQAIHSAKKNCDFVVVMPHWGLEHTTNISARQRSQAIALVQAGADLVLGSHPHRLQAAECVGGKWVVFSLGNFVFDAVGEDSNSVIERFTFRRQGITREAPIRVTIRQGFPTIPE